MIFYTYPTTLYLVYHSSQVQSLCLTKNSSEMFSKFAMFYMIENFRQNFWFICWNLFWTTESEIGRSEILNTELETLFFLSHNFFSFCLFAEMSLETLPQSILWRVEENPKNYLFFFAANENEWRKKKPPISSSWLKILWYLKKIK